jgi:hypothetical protein
MLAALRARLEPLPFVHSMWEGGSAAFDTDDELSDIDLQLDVDDDQVEAAFAEVRAALESLGPLDFRWELALPTWHGYPQHFYHVAGSPEFLYLDLVVRPLGQEQRLTEREQHGEPRIHFDKRGLVQASALDRAAHAEKVRARYQTLRTSFAMLAGLCRKELLRGDLAAAVGFYHTHTLRPLVEMLRIKHCPERHDFGLRYLSRDLPAEDAQRVTRLCFFGSAAELSERHAEAVAWFTEVAESVDIEHLWS